MPYPNFHAARVRRPGDFTRIRQLRQLPNGVRILGGPLKADPRGGTKAQSYWFPRDRFSAAEARAWLREHKIRIILFERATP
jgi:hypothetical protein